MAELDLQSYVEHTRIEGERIIAALDVNPTASVPSCPGWTVVDLVSHCATIWSNFAKVVANPSTEAPSLAPVEAPTDPAELSSWSLAQLDELLSALSGVDVEQPIWTFAGTGVAGFYPRRMAQENAIHRWDAELAIGGDVSPIDTDLAADGIDEYLHLHVPRRLGRTEPENHPSGTLHLHRTDGEGEWMIALVDGEVKITIEHGKGDAAVRGSANDLYLYMWGRTTGESIEIFGDEAVAVAWTTLA